MGQLIYFPPDPPPVRETLSGRQLRAAVADLCEHEFAILELEGHARQVVASARESRLAASCPFVCPVGWRVELE